MPPKLKTEKNPRSKHDQMLQNQTPLQQERNHRREKYVENKILWNKNQGKINRVRQVKPRKQSLKFDPLRKFYSTQNKKEFLRQKKWEMSHATFKVGQKGVRPYSILFLFSHESYLFIIMKMQINAEEKNKRKRAA